MRDSRTLNAVSTTYTADDLCGRQANQTSPIMFQDPGFFHTSTLTVSSFDQCNSLWDVISAFDFRLQIFNKFHNLPLISGKTQISYDLYHKILPIWEMFLHESRFVHLSGTETGNAILLHLRHRQRSRSRSGLYSYIRWCNYVGSCTTWQANK